MASETIVLLTDFGDKDPYVGIMKGVISQISPAAKLIDLGHQIPPGDIQEAAFQLWQAAGHFPSGTVFLAVVDPGVGTDRKGLYFQRKNQAFIGPDNGLFTYLTYKASPAVWELANPDLQLPDPSNTFHGRDIFAPAAAYAALGTPGDQFGNKVQSLIQLPQPLCHAGPEQLRGEVISVDRFGNLITSLGLFKDKQGALGFDSWIEERSLDIPGILELSVDQTGGSIPLVSTFAEIPPESCALMVGSSGLLEIAAQQASAASMLDLSRGDQITISIK